jgi:dihydrofolate reductase
VSDARGNFDWAAPDDEVHAFVNDLERSVGTYLYGRRMYETMVFWENPGDAATLPAVEQDYAQIWQAADKVVFSRTLTRVTSAKTKLELEFDPDSVRELKETSTSDLSVGGPDLAAQAIEAGLVDEYAVFFVPVLVGGGHRWLRDVDVRVDLEPLDQRRFGSGVVYVRYRTR